MGPKGSWLPQMQNCKSYVFPPNHTKLDPLGEFDVWEKMREQWAQGNTLVTHCDIIHIDPASLE